MSPLSNLRATLTQIYPPRPSFTAANVPPGSQKGRVFVVTGGNSGIGFELCKILYIAGATIYMLSRTKAKAEAAIKDIIESSPSKHKATSGEVKFIHFDLNDLLSVKAAAEEFARQESKLDVLWNNAGTGANGVEIGQRTAQGFDAMIGMHCIATLYFTTLLTPQLRAAASASKGTGSTRVIWTSSGLAEAGSHPNGIDFNVLDKGTDNRMKNYGASKAGSWILSKEFARRYGKDDIVSVCINPGYLKTASFNGTPPLAMFFMNHLMLHDTIYGAYTELFAGLSPEVTLENNGSYIIPWGRVRSDEATPRPDIVKAMTPESEGGLGYGEKFWTWCETEWKKFV